MRTPKILALSLMVVSLSHCQKTGTAPESQPPLGAEALPQGAFVIIAATPLRIAPTQDDYVPRPHASHLSITNVIGRALPGRLATLRQRNLYYSEVILDDDAEGWVENTALRPVEATEEATVLKKVALKTHASDDAGTLGVIQEGDLIFILQNDNDIAGGDFTRVHHATLGTGYVDARAIVTHTDDVTMAHVLLRAHIAEAQNDTPELLEIWESTRYKPPQSVLMQNLADMIDVVKTHNVAHAHGSQFERGL